ISRMQAQQERLVAEIWERRRSDLPIETVEEFVTLASIVEKETGVAEERPRVASVFINRLNRGMRLQSDPTIIYGIFGGEGKPADRPIYRSDIDTPTDYNTYTIPALPPGPIAIPGRASLEAVANPAQTTDLFFVADGTGGHAFAETLEEHNRNVARWREIERQREAEAESGGENGTGN
ncbi:MAG: endolytic transglycosylase MltG, partial [Pseudomonadota bacterium]